MIEPTRAPWRLADEGAWVVQGYGATIRGAMPAGPLRCYGCGRWEWDPAQTWETSDRVVDFGAMLSFRNETSGERWELILCSDCWANAAIENGRLTDLWDTIPQPTNATQ